MTMMAMTEPYMKRLFSRIDSMPRPRDETLVRLFQFWLDAKGDAIAPKTVEFAQHHALWEAEGGFMFSISSEGPREYELHAGTGAVAALLGSLTAGSMLDSAPSRRGAVRCRRLFDWVRKTSEPILVEFQNSQPGHEPTSCEVLVLPLMDKDGQTPNALLGGMACRPAANGRRQIPVMHSHSRKPLFFASARDQGLAQRIVQRLGATLSPLEEREFEDGEHKIRPMVDVAGHEVYVIASLNGDDRYSVNDRLCRLLFFIGALKTNGATRITAVTPYLCYLRKDRQTKPHDPLTARYVAQLFEAVGVDALITVDAHNPAALENAFRCPVRHLEAHEIFAAFFAGEINNEPVTVVAPDMGAGKRVENFRDVLEKRLGYPVGKAFMEKQRSQGVVTGDLFAGDVDGRVAIVLDDMICSGTTMVRAAEACHDRGATRIYLAATHGLFARDASTVLAKDSIAGIFVTNSVVHTADIPRVETLDISSLFAHAIDLWHETHAR